MEKIKYIRGNENKVNEIRRNFINLGAVNSNTFDFNNKNLFYYLDGEFVRIVPYDSVLLQFLMEHGEEIKLIE
jgi:hypothetical protein